MLFALVTEVALTGGTFFFREQTLKQFGVTSSAGNDFLVFIIGWCLLFVSLVCGYAAFLTWKDRHYNTLCYLLGSWWVAIGIAIYLVFGKPDNLVLDSLKGLLIILLAYRSKRK